MDNKTEGALTGAVIAAAANWSRLDDDTQRRLRSVRDNASDALDMVRDVASRGDAIRTRLAVVQDAQVGIAIASAVEPSPTTVPTVTPTQRPDIFTNGEVSVADMNWPPEPGQYDPRGFVTRAGELSTMFLSLTYEEVRAFVQGLAQRTSPNATGKVQVYYAANALVATVASLNLRWNDYRDAWGRLFGLPGAGVGTIGTSHANPLFPPSVSGWDAGIASVKPLGLPEINTGYKHNNTDAVSKWRITIGPGNVNSGTMLFTMAFNQPYTKGPDQFQPVVAANDPRLNVLNVTSISAAFQNNVVLLANQTYDIGISVAG